MVLQSNWRCGLGAHHGRSWDHACRRFTFGRRERGWGSQQSQSPSCVFLEAAGIGQSWERATAGHKPDFISYPLRAPRNERNQRRAGKFNRCYVWPLINSTFSATLLWTRLRTSGFTTTTRCMAPQSTKTAWTKRKCGGRRRGFWHIRLALLTDSKRQRSTAATSSLGLSFPSTEQGLLATSKTCGCLWRSAREQLSGARSTLLALRRSVWTAGRQLKHLARFQLRMTDSYTMWSKMLEWERLVRSWRSSRHEMGRPWPPRYLILHQIETRGGGTTLTRTGSWRYGESLLSWETTPM